MSRRERLQPEDVGLPRGRRRRVPGLRREEVASLAGLSIDYYVQLERGDLGGASDEVLAAVCRGLHLDEAETAYLFDLARARRPTPDRRPGRPESVPPRVTTAMRQLLAAMTGAPAVLHDASLDLVAENPLGRALYSRVHEGTPRGRTPNLAAYVFLDDDSRRFFEDWESIADDAAAMLRAELGRSPGNLHLRGLVDRLSETSRAFAQRWAAHDVADHRRGPKAVHHHEVGRLRLHYEVLEVSGQPGLRLFAYTPQPDDLATHEALSLLGSLAADRAAEDRETGGRQNRLRGAGASGTDMREAGAPEPDRRP